MNIVNRLLTAATRLTSGARPRANAPIRGAGAWTCTSHLANLRANNYEVLEGVAWVLGFVSSYNHFIALDRPDHEPDGVFPPILNDQELTGRWLEVFCLHHPKQTLYDGALQFIKEQEALLGAR